MKNQIYQMKLLALFYLIVSLTITVDAFTTTLTTTPISRPTTSFVNPVQQQGKQQVISTSFTTSSTTNTRLYERKEPYKGMGGNDGLRRGLVLQIIVFGICAWLFTIPPEFRRAYLCPADIYCQEEGSCSRDCVTTSEWISGVTEYYKGGGGIQWDFSIDPNTLKENQELLDQIQKK